MILDFLNMILPWNNTTANSDQIDNVGGIKALCLAEPERYLWSGKFVNSTELRNIFHSINALAYSDKPNYAFIHQQLKYLLAKEEIIGINIFPGNLKVPCEVRIQGRQQKCVFS